MLADGLRPEASFIIELRGPAEGPIAGMAPRLVSSLADPFPGCKLSRHANAPERRLVKPFRPCALGTPSLGGQGHRAGDCSLR